MLRVVFYKKQSQYFLFEIKKMISLKHINKIKSCYKDYLLDNKDFLNIFKHCVLKGIMIG